MFQNEILISDSESDSDHYDKLNDFSRFQMTFICARFNLMLVSELL
jgi:hypothetical protein